MITVSGIGWLTNEGYGGVRSRQRIRYENGEGVNSLPKRGIFSHSFKNFGRLDAISRMTAYAVALAVQDAGIKYVPGLKQDIGIIGTNTEGSLQADLAYFRDYVGSGRTLSRGNLFIYTLPSSPVGEAAIHFGFLGPLLYARGLDNSLVTVLDIAEEMITAKETSIMLAGKAEETEAVFFVLGCRPGQGEAGSVDLEDLRKIVKTTPGVASMIRELSLLTARKASCED
ncbi:MAG TPA: hypothetical protein VL122_03395 [Nitrospirota bacterium]|nr:hypothetical protein [Nitrospirota bacterium]